MIFRKIKAFMNLPKENQRLEEEIEKIQHREKLFEAAFYNGLDGLLELHFPPKVDNGLRFQLPRLEDNYNYFQEIDEVLKNVEPSFSVRLMELIREKNLDEVQVYKKAEIDRRLFSKIRWNDKYRPTKDTTVLLCMSMKLSIEETEDLLKRAGMAFSFSCKSDLIAYYFINKKIYDIPLYKEVLLHYDLLSKY